MYIGKTLPSLLRGNWKIWRVNKNSLNCVRGEISLQFFKTMSDDVVNLNKTYTTFVHCFSEVQVINNIEPRIQLRLESDVFTVPGSTVITKAHSYSSINNVKIRIMMPNIFLEFRPIRSTTNGRWLKLQGDLKKTG